MKSLRIATAVFSIGAALVGTYYLGRHSAPQPESPQGTASSRREAVEDRSFREILSDSNPITFRKGFLSYLEKMKADEALEAAQLLWNTPGELAEVKERQSLFSYAWGALDGEATVDFIMGNHSVAKVPALSQAFAGWASKDPNAAKAWIEAKLKPAERLLYNWALVDGWARHDPDAATEYVLSNRRSAGMAGMDRFARSIALEQVRRDPAMAAEWASKLPEGSMKNTAMDEIALRWSRVSPAAAADWTASVANQGTMKRSINVALTEWSRMDSVSAGKYLAAMPESTARDHAIAAHVRVLASEDLKAITAWAQLINDSALREEGLLQIANEWASRNPDELLAWLPGSGLSESARQKATLQLKRQ